MARTCIAWLHHQCHVTCEKILALLNGMGVVISKRQVARLLTTKLKMFRAEDAEVLRAGLSSALTSSRSTTPAPAIKARAA